MEAYQCDKPHTRNLLKSQLESTDATLVEVYSAGNTDVVFTQAPLHYEILISNKHRAYS